MLDYVIFWRGEILGPEEHPCPEITLVSFEGKVAVVVLLPACEACHHGIILH